MTTSRTTTVRKLVAADPGTVFRAFVDPAAVASWLPPGDMQGTVHVFEPREGGAFSMSLTYPSNHEGTQGKTTATSDRFEGRFVRLVADHEVVWATVFVSADPAFAGEMTVRTTITPAEGGAMVAITCDNIPAGIRLEDNAEGCRESLEKLAAFVETGQLTFHG